jgi:hypothetical protein
VPPRRETRMHHLLRGIHKVRRIRGTDVRTLLPSGLSRPMARNGEEHMSGLPQTNPFCVIGRAVGCKQ